MTDCRLLLVDDDSLVLEALSVDMSDRGFTVKTVSSGEEAFHLVEKDEVDVIIADLVMEGMNGIELLRMVKDYNNRIGVIIMTGYGTLASAIEAVRFDADDYLVKPCESGEIALRIKSCLEKLGLRDRIMLYEGLLPICSVCHKVRDEEGVISDAGTWVGIDTFFKEQANIKYTHSYCPDCVKDIKNDLS